MLFFSRHGWISAISPCLGRGLPTTAVCIVNQVKTAAYVLVLSDSAFFTITIVT